MWKPHYTSSHSPPPAKEGEREQGEGERKKPWKSAYCENGIRRKNNWKSEVIGNSAWENQENIVSSWNKSERPIQTKAVFFLKRKNRQEVSDWDLIKNSYKPTYDLLK